jgi:hypothetical protein
VVVGFAIDASDYRAHCADLILTVHLVTPRRTASTAANAVVTQVMFRKFDLTIGNNPDRSDAFNDLPFLRGLLFRGVTGFLFAIDIPVSKSSGTWMPALLVAFPDGSWCPCFHKIADKADETFKSCG